MSVEEARRFVRESQSREEIKEAFNILKNETYNIIALSKELGYEFTPGELVQAVVEEVFT